MKKILFAAAASAVAFTALPAAAQAWYGQANLGYTFGGQADVDAAVSDGVDSMDVSGEVDLDGGFLISGAVGTGMSNGLRFEAEVLSTKNDVDGSEDVDLGEVEVGQLGLFANVLFDIPAGDQFRPYVGAGLGISRTTVDVEGEELDDQGLAWQLRAGVAIPAGESFLIDVGYRYLRGAELDKSVDMDGASASLQAEPSVHALTVGGRFTF